MRLVVDTKALTKRLGFIVKAIDQTNKSILEEAIQHGAEVAKRGYVDPDYNGVIDAHVSVNKIEDGFELRASGESVRYIEFGTGVGRDKGYQSSKTGEPYWWFYNTGPVHLTRGAHALRTSGGRTRYSITGPRGGKRYIDPYTTERYEITFGKDRKGKTDYDNPRTAKWTTEHTREVYNKRSREYDVHRFYRKHEAEIERETTATKMTPKTNSYITMGNEPNYVMQKAIEETERYFEEALRK